MGGGRDATVLARLRAAAGGLGPSEAKVAAVILARAPEVVDWSTAELADAAGTSAATVIRACQSLGLRGFQHLRLELARIGAPADQGDPATRDRFDDAVDALRHAQVALDHAVLDDAARALERAGRRLLVGSGFSGPPLQDMAMRLSTVGVGAEAPADPLAQQFAAHTLAAGDVVLALSYSGANAQTLRACTAAIERGAEVVAVTSFARSPLGRLADVVIATGAASSAHEIDPALARLAHTVVLHELHARLAARADRPGIADMRDVVADAITDEQTLD